MSFLFQCPICRNVREANDNIYGKRVRCADCENFVVVDDSTIVHPSASPQEVTPEAVEVTPEVVPEATAVPVQAIEVTAESVVPAAKPAPKRKSSKNPYASAQPSGSSSGGDDGASDDLEFEQMELPKGEKRNDDEMDMTPMVDVTFLLLIFFMVTASFVLQKSMDLPTKTQDEPSPNVIEDFEDNQEYVSVFVSPYNEYRIRTPEYDWEDAPNRHELAVRLRDALQGKSKPEKMLIMAHADCYHDKVIQAMDIGIELKYKIQVIMTEEEF